MKVPQRVISPIVPEADKGYQLIVVEDGRWPYIVNCADLIAMARTMSRYQDQIAAVVPIRGSVLPVVSPAGGSSYVLADERTAVEVTSGKPNVIPADLVNTSARIEDFYLGPDCYRTKIDKVKDDTGTGSFDDQVDSL